MPAVGGVEVLDDVELFGPGFQNHRSVPYVRIKQKRLVVFVERKDFETVVLEKNGAIVRQSQIDDPVAGKLRDLALIIGYKMRPVETHDPALGRHPDKAVFILPELHDAVLRQAVVARIMLLGEI